MNMLKYIVCIACIFISISLNAQDIRNFKLPDSACFFLEHKAALFIKKKSADALLGEMFESSNFPPASWDTTNVEWYHSSQTAHGLPLNQIEAASTGHTGHFLVFDAYNNNVGVVASLITPRLHPTPTNNVLSYKVELFQLSTDISNKGTGAKLFIEFSTDNGITWTVSTNNILAALPNYNTATTGWQTGSVSLSAYNNQTVRARFRAVSDWGWCDILLDNISGPDADILTYSNEIIAKKSWADFNGLGYYGMIPNSQLGIVDFAGVVMNTGSFAQSNVTLHANINNSAFSGVSGLNNPLPLLDTSATDTLFARLSLSATVPTNFKTKLWFTQAQNDQQPLNNIADSLYFSSSFTNFSRANIYDTYVTPYSFGVNAPAISGMAFGSTYHFIANAQIDSIYVNIYKNKGSTSLKAVLFSMNLINGTIIQVDSSLSEVVPVTESTITSAFKLLSPYQVTAGSILIAAIKMNFSAGTDTISILAQSSSFPGDLAKASRCYLHQSTGWSWNPVNFVPSVGIIIKSNTSAEKLNDNSDVYVFPNPTTGIFHIECAQNTDVKIFNLMGQEIIKRNYSSTNNMFDMGNLPEGSYFVKMRVPEGEITRKIVLVK